MHPTAEASRRRPPARQLLLTAAARVFARDGLEGATTRAISREAGVNEVTLFRHFGTKEHLIKAVVGTAFARTGGRPKATAGSARRSLRTDLTAFARDYEELLVANLPLIRTMLGEIHRHADCHHQALRGIFSPMREALVERLRRASKAGEAKGGLNPSIAADLFSSTIFTAVLKRSKAGVKIDYSASEYRDASVEVFLGGIGAR